VTTQADQRNGLTDKVKRGQEEVRGLGHEVGDIASEFRELGRLELELAQAEIREQAGHVTRAALFGAITGVLVGVLAVFIFVTLWSVLDSFMAEWLAV
jgi:acid phosphatase family membrane protein YuiD